MILSLFQREWGRDVTATSPREHLRSETEIGNYRVLWDSGLRDGLTDRLALHFCQTKKGHRLKKSGTPEEKTSSELNTRCKYELGANVGNIWSLRVS